MPEPELHLDKAAADVAAAETALYDAYDVQYQVMRDNRDFWATSWNTMRDSRDAERARADAAEQARSDIQAAYTAHLALKAPAGHAPADPEPVVCPPGTDRAGQVIPAGETEAWCTIEEPPPPGRALFTKRGYWLKQGPPSLAQLRAARQAVPGIIGYSDRETLADIADDPDRWNRDFDLAVQAGYTLMAGRPVTGWKMDVAEMGRTLIVGTAAQSGVGKPFPAPFETNGQPNTRFIDALTVRMTDMIDAILDHTDEDFPVAHVAWPGQQWAEVYYGPEVRAAAGHSRDNFIGGYNAIIDRMAELQRLYPKVIIGFQLSGHGPVADMVDDWTRRIAEKFEPEKAMIHANGWSHSGQWGQASSSVDTEMDAAFVLAAAEVPGLPGFDDVLAGCQAIQDWGASSAFPRYTDAQVRSLMGQLRAGWADSFELYPGIFTGPEAATLQIETARWLAEPRN